MNACKEAYFEILGFYKSVLTEVARDLAGHKEYLALKEKMTVELADRDGEEFDNLNRQISLIEQLIDQRHERWEVFSCLISAEMMMIRAYSGLLKARPDLPEHVYHLFSEENLAISQKAHALNPELVNAILGDDHF